MRLTARFLTASIFLSAAATTAAYATVRCVKPGTVGNRLLGQRHRLHGPPAGARRLGLGRRALGRGGDVQADGRHGPNQELPDEKWRRHLRGLRRHRDDAQSARPVGQRDGPVGRHRDGGHRRRQQLPRRHDRLVRDVDRRSRRLHDHSGPSGRRRQQQQRRRHVDQRRERLALTADLLCELCLGTGRRRPRHVCLSDGPRLFLPVQLRGNSGAGGALYSGGGSAVYLQNCIFRSNQISGASVGGGAIDTAGGTTLVNCVIAQNSPNGIADQHRSAETTSSSRTRPSTATTRATGWLSSTAAATRSRTPSSGATLRARSSTTAVRRSAPSTATSREAASRERATSPPIPSF